MFFCELGKHISQSGEKQHKLPSRTRQKEYFDDKNQKIGHGWEIVEESTACDSCKLSRKENVR